VLPPVSDGSLGRCLTEEGEIQRAGRLPQKTLAQEWELEGCFLYQPSGRFADMESRNPRQGQSYSRSEGILLQTKGRGFLFSCI